MASRQHEKCDMGISNDDHLVLYDHGGVFSAFRVYWTFKVFGHQKISVLNGGMDAWNKGNFETTSKISKIVNRERYHTKFDSTLLTTYKNIIENIETKEKQVIDARSKERFYGQVPEPRIGIHSGHIPNSINVPFNTLIDKSTSSLLKEDELAKVFLGQVKQLGVKEVSVFDGSWSEYASYAESPIDCKNT
ncbi:threonyl-tRNA synthetase [Clydaea vesicula]|uniref:Sulfurtransferase n=1 Tax=Clydaea vesicula TaxID=447962 RepID=A0AAD5U732_9FUNG|nr:threonyl-tRNA synthetase [Clydaea vesicula]